MADGSIRIDTKINRKGAEQGLEELKKTADTKVKQLEQGVAKAGKQVENLNNKFSETSSELAIVNAQMDSVARKVSDKFKDFKGKGSLKGKQWDSFIQGEIEADSEYKKLVTQQGKLEAKMEQYSQKIKNAESNQKQLNSSLKIAKQEQSGATKKLEESKKSADRLNATMKIAQKAGSALKTSCLGIASSIGAGAKKVLGLGSALLKTKRTSDGLTSSIGNGVKQVAKYGLALLSIRQIYSLLSSSASAWLNSGAEGTKQLKADVDSLKVAIGSGLQPIIQFIYNTIVKILSVVASLIKAFTGVNIFANATSKNLSSATGNAKKLKKELSTVGFDEQEKLQDNSDSSSSGGVNLAPSIDYTKLADQFADLANKIKAMVDAGDWFGIGALIGQKLNEAMASIPWDSIQNTARQIGINIANLLNGFIATTDWYLLGNTIAQGLNTALYFAYGFITTFDWKMFGLALANGFSGLLNNIDWQTLALTISYGLNGMFGTIYTFFTNIDWNKIAHDIVAALNTMINTIDWALIGQAIGNGISSAINFIYTVVTEFDWQGCGKSLAIAVMNLFNSIDWNKLASSFAQGINGVFQTLRGFIDNFDWIGTAVTLSEGINTWFEEIDWAGIATTLSDAFSNLLDSVIFFLGTLDWASIGWSIGEFLANIDWLGIIQKVCLIIVEVFGGLGIAIISGICSGIVNALINIGDWIRENIIDPIVTAFCDLLGIHSPSTVFAEFGENIIQGLFNGITSLVDTIKEIWQKMKETAVEIFNNLKSKIVEIIENLKTSATEKVTNIKNTITNIFTNIKTKAQEIWENIKSVVTEKINNLKANISNTLNNIKTVWDNIWNSLKNTVTNIWNGIWGTIKNVINSILSGIEAMANGIVRGVNKIIDTLNNLQVHIPDWVPMFGNKTLGFNINHMGEVSLPRLARGGIAMQPTQAIVGEAGKEAILPLQNNTEWMDEMAEIFADKIRDVLEELDFGDTIVNNILDGEAMQRVFTQRNNRRNLATNGRWS